jgi:hypothetical protein
MKTLINIYIIFFAFITANAQVPIAGGISVKPVRLFYTLLNGETSIQTVYVINNTKDDKQFNLYLQDWNRDTLGAHNYLPLGSYPHSCAKWITLNKDFIEVKAGETKEVLVKVKIPDSLDAINEMKWTMLFIQSAEEKLAPSKVEGFSTAVQNITRIGVHIVQTPPTLKDKDLKMLSFTKKVGEKNQYRIICENTGKVQFDCKTYIELSCVATGEKTVLKRDLFPLFPNQIRYADFIIPETLPKGKYVVVAVADGGDDIPLQASEANIVVE